MAEIQYTYHPLWNYLNDGQPYEPFPWQAEHLHSKIDQGVKRIILACGRRSGKSHSVRAEVAREVVRAPEVVHGVTHAPIVYIVGPTTELAQRVFRPMWQMFVPSQSGYVPPLGFLYKSHDKNAGYIELNNGAVIWRKSGDDPRGLQGERVTMAITEETQDMPEDAWQNLMPALGDSGGRLISIGIPRGKGRFRSFWQRGQDTEDRFHSVSVPTGANPIMHERAKEEGFNSLDEYIEEVLAADLTEIEVQQQWYARWMEEDGQVFNNHLQYFTGQWEESPQPGHAYIMGLDVGKKVDYTVAYVIDAAEERIVAKDRFNGIDYLAVGTRVANLYHKFNCAFVHMDATGVGEPTADILRHERCSVIPFKFTNASKAALINTFVSELQHGRVILPKFDADLQKEMDLFEAKVMPGGLIRYEHPPGYHDDCVIAAALAVFKARRNRRLASSPMQKNYLSWQKPKRRRELIAA